MPATDIFISYRRHASGGHAGRLYASLISALGRRRVFMDVSGIDPGANFVQVLREALTSCRTMLVVIGPDWCTLKAGDGATPRLSTPDDWVRIEVEHALALDVRVLPILVGDARMPTASDLPESLRALADLQAFDLRDSSWDDDVRRLMRALGISPHRNAMRIALGIGATVLLVSAASLFLTSESSLTKPDAVPESDPFPRLVSLNPDQAQQEALVNRFRAAGLNVPVLRQFLTRAEERRLPAAALHAELETFAQRFNRLMRANRYDDTGATGQTTLKSDYASEALKLAKAGRFQEGQAQLRESAEAVRTRPRSTREDKVYAAWCLWLSAQIDHVLARLDSAQAQFDEAARVNATAQPPSNQLQYRVLRDSARLASERADFKGAIDRLKQVEPIASDYYKPDVFIDLAELLDKDGKVTQAVDYRARAQALFDRASDPGDKRARENAARVAQDLERSGRVQDAKALRDRYGLANAAQSRR